MRDWRYGHGNTHRDQYKNIRWPRWRGPMHVYIHWAKDHMYMKKYY